MLRPNEIFQLATESRILLSTLLSPLVKKLKMLVFHTEMCTTLFLFLRRLAGDKLLSSDKETGETLTEAWRIAAKKFAGNDFMGTLGKDGYEFITYAQAFEIAENFGKGFKSLTGLEAGSNVGISMKTCKEWNLAQRGVEARSLVVVTLYSTLGDEAIDHILNLCEIEAVICTPDQVASLLKVGSKHLKTIILCQNGDADKPEAQGITFHTFEEVCEAGKAVENEEDASPKPDDTAVILFTSGTTGVPKGVMHTHRSIMASTYASRDRFTLDEGEVFYCFLPLAHIMEQFLEHSIMIAGGKLGYYGGNTKLLVPEVQKLQPTIFVAVPRLLNKVYQLVCSKLQQNDPMKKFMTSLAVQSKRAGLAKGLYRSFWDFIVFSKVAATLGGKVKKIITGSAPIAKEVLSFYRIFFSAQVAEGYGMTEVWVTNSTYFQDLVALGTVGAPYKCVEIRLEDVPNMEYYHTDKPRPRGEICFRGPNVMKGYYKNPEKTAETIDKDGWLHSGDIGEWDERGNLRIIDRKKNIFKLSQGEYVAPLKCENIFKRDPFVGQILVYGDSLKSCLVGVVVPDADVLPVWAAKAGIPEDKRDFKSLCALPQLKKLMLGSINKTGRSAGLKGFEIVKAIHIHDDPFTVENDSLTPTFKLKRRVVAARFQDEIDAMYKELGP